MRLLVICLGLLALAFAVIFSIQPTDPIFASDLAAFGITTPHADPEVMCPDGTPSVICRQSNAGSIVCIPNNGNDRACEFTCTCNSGSCSWVPRKCSSGCKDDASACKPTILVGVGRSTYTFPVSPYP